MPPTAHETPPESPSRVPQLQTGPLLGAYDDIYTVQARINDFKNILRPKIRDFLTNPRFPTWLPPGSVDDETQQFYRDLGVPLVNMKPSLLLHDLGVTPNPNADNLFQGTKDQIFWNAPGTGKTRLLLEGLSRRWGFYFVIAQGSDGIGAPDLEAVIAVMSHSPGWTDDIFKDPNSERVRSADHTNQTKNEAIASNWISKVILARWVVFKTFIQVAKELELEGVMLQDNIQRDWLLFQILPSVRINDMDPFSALVSLALRGVHSEVLNSLRAPLGPTNVLGSSFNSMADSFFYVIDGAQVAGKQYMGAFADQDGIKERPVLDPIMKYMMYLEVTGPFKVIISGTAFSLELFRGLKSSSVGKDTWFNVEHTTGDFSDPGTQFLYISRYLPPSFLASDSGIILGTRVYDWLRGRYRFTARFLEELMSGSWDKDRPASPHKLLDDYIQQFTGFMPFDSDEM